MIGIIDYGMGNLRSVQKALEFIGASAVISGECAALDRCEKLILPGVGSFGAGMREMRRTGLDAYVRERTSSAKLLGICLGMQFLLETGYEDGKNEGLGLIPGEVVRFGQGKIPQIGWNAVYRLQSPLFAGIPEGEHFYFVHGYRAKTRPQYAAAVTKYFEEYPSAIWNGNVFGVQFHPEKIGEAGLKLLKNFIELQ